MSIIQHREWVTRNPQNLNPLRINGFSLQILAIPKVTFFCQTADIPALALGQAIAANPLVDVPRPGEKLTFTPLTVKFLVQEDLGNYMELHHWLIGLGFPENRNQHDRLRKGLPQNPPDISQKTTPGEYSDATLLVLDSNYDPVASIIFRDLFPTGLSAMNFSSTEDNTTYIQATATFAYTDYTIERVRKTT